MIFILCEEIVSITFSVMFTFIDPAACLEEHLRTVGLASGMELWL